MKCSHALDVEDIIIYNQCPTCAETQGWDLEMEFWILPERRVLW